MTLILSCLTKDYVIQVSDRRLTRPDGTVFDDNANKAIFLNGNVVFAYTGLAFIDRKTRIDAWLLNTLSEAYKVHPDADLTGITEYVAEKATNTISNISTTPSLKRLAFVGVGWGKLEYEGNLRPIYIIISNTHTEDGKWLEEAQAKFLISVLTPLENESVWLVSDPRWLDKKLRVDILRLLRKCVQKSWSKFIGSNSCFNRKEYCVTKCTGRTKSISKFNSKSFCSSWSVKFSFNITKKRNSHFYIYAGGDIRTYPVWAICLFSWIIYYGVKSI